MPLFSNSKKKEARGSAPKVVEESTTASSIKSGLIREAIKGSLTGSPSADGATSTLSGILGLAGGGGESNAAGELFDIPTDFEDYEQLRSLMAKSDVPAEQVIPITFLLAMAERFQSSVMPTIIGYYLTGRIAKNREGRKEYLKATQKTLNLSGNDDDD